MDGTPRLGTLGSCVARHAWVRHGAKAMNSYLHFDRLCVERQGSSRFGSVGQRPVRYGRVGSGRAWGVKPAIIA